MRGLIGRPFKKSLLVFFIPLLLCPLLGEALSQPVSKEDTGPQIKLGEITFRTRETESKPELASMLELHIQVLNRSATFAASPNSIRAVVVPKEITTAEGSPLKDFDPGPVEMTLSVPLPPRTGRVLTIGFPLPKGKTVSMTFEIQINPPDGEKKTVTWSGK